MILRIFIDIDKEEKWLNIMSENGNTLTAHSFGKYVFEESENKSTYEITFNNSDEDSDEINYIQLMKDYGAKETAVYKDKVYFQNPLYNDQANNIDDFQYKIKWYHKLFHGFVAYALTALIIALVFFYLENKINVNDLVFKIIAIIFCAVFVLLFGISVYIRTKIKVKK